MDDCIGVPQLGYGEFSDWLHSKVAGQRVPIAGSLEVSMHCNLRCQHCYIPAEVRSGGGQPELNLDEIKRILDEITDAGCLWLLLTGGEPLLRREILDIYRSAKNKGLILTLFTNGTMLTPRIADYLAEWRPFDIEISLYGATQQTYEHVTGIPGSYSRCRHGIELLLERKLPLRLKTMVMTLNKHELDQMKALASNLGLKFRADPIINPAINGSSRPLKFRISPEEVVALDKSDHERSKSLQKVYNNIQAIPISDRRLFLCGAGLQGFHIDATGQLSVCMTARKPSYALLDGTFAEGWTQFIPSVLTRQYNIDFSCLPCNLRSVCGQCPGVAELEHGKNDHRVEFLCRIAHLRRSAFTLVNNV